MKVVVASFNQEMALVGAFSVIVQLCVCSTSFKAVSKVLEAGVPRPDSSAGSALGIPGRLRDVRLQCGSVPPHHWRQQTSRFITRKIVSYLLQCFVNKMKMRIVIIYLLDPNTSVFLQMKRGSEQ